MVSVLFHLVIVTLNVVVLVHAQDVGQYFRPTGDQVSGDPKSQAKFLRSPCPALNALANHGHLPRDGRQLTQKIFRDAIMKVYNVDFSVAKFQTDPLPSGRMTLADLSRHNLIEHDASFVHADMFYRQDPAQVDGGLGTDLLRRAVNGQFGAQELGIALRDRLIWCQQKPPGCDFGASQRSITFLEAATILQIFGDKRTNTIRDQHLHSFMILEQIPSDWHRPARPVTLKELNALSTQIQRIAGV